MTAPAPTYPNHANWIQVHSGTPFDLVNPDPATINEHDIAIALSRQPRFGGHTTRPYSVAQHSLAVAHLLTVTGQTPTVILQGLLHDATEAYVVDVPRPLKAMLPEYKAIEGRVWSAIAKAFDVPEELDPEVKWADEEALKHEAAFLLPGGPQGWGYVIPDLHPPAIMFQTFTPDMLAQYYLTELRTLKRKAFEQLVEQAR
ncbi:hydrolase [Deinococcus sp. UR1]|uniref:hydrolase n=1 Tax=Deinococcus sp. UR1 TaxID=1704277 RepID=UPI001F5399BA|nr:hydrolase [Deinococcus sp. UR1]